MPRSPLALILPLLVAACSKPSVQVPVSASSAQPAASTAPRPSASAAPAAPTCDFSHGMHGKVGEAEVFARLAQAGASVTGSYEYARVGKELTLAGSVEGGRVHLIERSGPVATGRLDGTCDADGHLRGGWSKVDAREGGAPTPFDLAPVLPQPTLLVLTRTQARAFPPRPRPKGSPEAVGFFEKNERCTETLAWPEVFGAATPEAEQKLNKALVRDRWILASHEEEEQLKACVTGDRIAASQSFQVTFNDKSVVSVSFSVIGRAEGGTHPWDPGAASEETYDTMTGARVTKADLLATTPKAKHALDALLGRCLAEGFPPDVAGDMKEKLSSDNPDLAVRILPRGLLFAGQGYAPPLRNLEGQGPTIAWSALASAGVLKSDASVARIWSDAKPAKAGDNPCVPDAKPGAEAGEATGSPADAVAATLLKLADATRSRDVEALRSVLKLPLSVAWKDNNGQGDCSVPRTKTLDDPRKAAAAVAFKGAFLVALRRDRGHVRVGSSCDPPDAAPFGTGDPAIKVTGDHATVHYEVSILLGRRTGGDLLAGARGERMARHRLRRRVPLLTARLVLAQDLPFVAAVSQGKNRATSAREYSSAFSMSSKLKRPPA